MATLNEFSDFLKELFQVSLGECSPRSERGMPCISSRTLFRCVTLTDKISAIRGKGISALIASLMISRNSFVNLRERGDTIRGVLTARSLI